MNIVKEWNKINARVLEVKKFLAETIKRVEEEEQRLEPFSGVAEALGAELPMHYHHLREEVLPTVDEELNALVLIEHEIESRKLLPPEFHRLLPAPSPELLTTQEHSQLPVKYEAPMGHLEKLNIPAERGHELACAMLNMHAFMAASKQRHISPSKNELVLRMCTALALPPEQPRVMHVMNDIIESAVHYHHLREEVLPTVDEELEALRTAARMIESVEPKLLPLSPGTEPEISTGQSYLPVRYEESLEQRLQKQFTNIPAMRLGAIAHAVESVHEVLALVEQKHLVPVNQNQRTELRDSLTRKLSTTLYPQLMEMNEMRKILRAMLEVTENAMRQRLKEPKLLEDKFSGIYNEIISWVSESNMILTNMESKISYSEKRLQDAGHAMKKKEYSSAKALYNQTVADAHEYMDDITRLHTKVDEFVQRLESVA
ncbi:MAG: hypothetical protein J4473_01595 [Candidatus Aenigmarchaeota archaeon]|nr:hypothetical protein [Candidatus Aenigmarchaeota archaeon]